MALDFRALAVATAGFTAFVNLYSPQALLPELALEFGVGAGDISALMTAGTGAIALTAPFTGALADVLGRKRLITAAAFAIVVPTLIMALATSVPQLVFWRFVQGLLLPPIFTVAVAYVGDEWPPADVPRVAGLFISGSSVGGFCGRFVTGAVADLLGWRVSFAAVALLTLAGGLDRHRRAAARAPLRPLRRLCCLGAANAGASAQPAAPCHLCRRLRRAVQFHRHLHLCELSPRRTAVLLHADALGALFASYLGGSLVVPWVGRAIALFGRRRFVLGIIALWAAGTLMLLAPPVPVIVIGLTLCATCGLSCQAVSTGYVITIAKEGRSAAAGLYASSFYIGGSAGAFLVGFVWDAAGWTGCVATIVASQAIMAAIVAIAWERSRG